MTDAVYRPILLKPNATFTRRLPGATSCVVQDQGAQNLQSDLDLHCPIMKYFPYK